MSQAIKDQIRAAALELGFARCGFARPTRPPHADFVELWVEEGNAAGMAYLGKRLGRRLDPTNVLKTVRSIITLSNRYAPPPLPPHDWRESLRGRIAAYALGGDYHKAIGPRLAQLARQIEMLTPGSRALWYIDTGAILEREWASLGGIGWFGKNTNILRRDDGSWFFLGEIFTSLDLEPDAPVADHCGTCTRCLDSCPTGALAPGYKLDARRCISYWTIEHRGAIPLEMRPLLGNWIFGCDECQEVCPWNDDHKPPEAAASPLLPYLPDLLALDDAAFEATYRDTSLWRTKRDGLLRNVAIALGNSGNPGAVPALGTALRSDASPLVRLHSAWALGVLGTSAARTALDRALVSEADDNVLNEIHDALAGGPTSKSN